VPNRNKKHHRNYYQIKSQTSPQKKGFGGGAGGDFTSGESTEKRTTTTEKKQICYDSTQRKQIQPKRKRIQTKRKQIRQKRKQIDPNQHLMCPRSSAVGAAEYQPGRSGPPTRRGGRPTTRSTTAPTPPVTQRERSTGEGGGKGNRGREAPYIGEGFRWGEEEEKGGKTFPSAREPARAGEIARHRPQILPPGRGTGLALEKRRGECAVGCRRERRICGGLAALQ
jgi:hypothetical protein